MKPNFERVDELPKDAVRVHLINYESIFRPRGSMKKNSLGEYILDKLEGTYEYWTDEEYGDNPPVKDLLETMEKNLWAEVSSAWNEFMKKHILSKESENV